MTTIFAGSALKSRLSLSDITEIDQACDVVVDLTTQMLERQLSTSFALVTQEDHFRVLSPLKSGTECRATLMLRSGFVSTDPAPVIKRGTSPADASAAAALEDEEYTVNLEKGIVEVRSTDDLRNTFFAVEYESGFDVSAGVYTGLPNWLLEAAYALASVQFYSLYPQYKPDNVTNSALDNWRNAAKVLTSGRTRYGGTSAVYPI